MASNQQFSSEVDGRRDQRFSRICDVIGPFGTIIRSVCGALLATTFVMAPFVTAPQSAQARPFEDGDLFVGPAIKERAEDRFFFGGARFQVAPVRALIQSEVKKQVDKVAGDDEQGAAIRDVIENLDTEQVRALADSGQLEEFKAMLKAEMQANGQELSPAQQGLIDGLDENKLRVMADLVDMYNSPPETLTFSLEPYAGLNFTYFTLTGKVALAGFTNPETKATTVQLGNVGLDLHTGARHGHERMAFGWTVGVAGYAPTGTEDANRVALSNVLASPAYLREYWSAAPYLVLGFGLPFGEATIHGKYVYMQADPSRTPVGQASFEKVMGYLHAGGALRANFGFMGASLELDALIDVGQAAPISNVLLMSAGVRGYLKMVQLGAGIQVPVVSPDAKDQSVNMGGVAVGSVASYNVLVTAQVKL